VRDRRHVADGGDGETDGLQRAQRRLAARTGTAHFDLDVRMPCSIALRPAFSAAIWAANGVDLREPLKPCWPDDDQAMVLPCASVMVTMVLLNEAFTCATPAMMFLRPCDGDARRSGGGAA
jgi:hypothetical protein